MNPGIKISTSDLRFTVSSQQRLWTQTHRLNFCHLYLCLKAYKRHLLPCQEIKLYRHRCRRKTTKISRCCSCKGNYDISDYFKQLQSVEFWGRIRILTKIRLKKPGFFSDCGFLKFWRIADLGL